MRGEESLEIMLYTLYIHKCVHLREAHIFVPYKMGFPGSSDGKEYACNAGDLGSIPVSGRSPGGGNGNPLQYSCLENCMDKRASQATVHGVAKSQT